MIAFKRCVKQLTASIAGQQTKRNAKHQRQLLRHYCEAGWTTWYSAGGRVGYVIYSRLQRATQHYRQYKPKEQHNITGSTSPKSNTTLQAVPAQRATQHYKPNGMSTNCGNISQPHPLFHTNCSSTYHCFLRRFPSSLHHRLSLLLFFLLHFIHPIRYMAILVFRSEQVSRKSWYNVPNYTAS